MSPAEATCGTPMPTVVHATRAFFGDSAESDAVIAMAHGRVEFAGPSREWHAGPEAAFARDHGPAVRTLEASLVTPGLVDAHTHSAWVGSRHAEYAVRMAGGDYRAIAAAGGGIAASGAHIAAATEDEIAHVLNERLRRMAALGVTCVEVKSGYGLTLEGELKQLRAIARVARCGDVPHVVPTYLALHALPRGMDRARYIEAVSTESLDAIAGDRLALFVDAYVDANAFSCAEASGVLERAAGRGLGIRLHIGQFADVGGAEFAARVGAASVDHVEHIDARGIDQLARAGVAVGLLPTASFTLAQAPPPVDAFRRAGISMFVASDANPGTAPTESLPLALAFAVRHYGLTVDEALSGATRNAANALAEHERGRLAKGARADVVLWDLPHEACITQPWGVPKARWVFRDGLVLVAPPPESRG